MKLSEPQIYWLKRLAASASRSVPTTTFRALEKRGLVYFEGVLSSGHNGSQDGWSISLTEEGRRVVHTLPHFDTPKV